ncbi:MAG: SagB/ThcOx family dehydrogenase [Lentisphaerae bacterium]|nr:SagB/ThcOx family dehydrogenase [Lentisphaerota bacterium]
MKKRLLGGVMALACSAVLAADNTNGNILLPEVNLKGDVSLKTALEKRRTARNFAKEALSPAEISNLLWAAYGVNRPNGKRTVPAALGKHAIELYVALPDGVYKHDLGNNELIKVSKQDVRFASDGRKMGSKAPLVIIMVADNTVFGAKGERYVAMEAGAIMQNIYLFCSAYKFNTVVCGSFDKTVLNNVLSLPQEKFVILTQVVGCGG